MIEVIKLEQDQVRIQSDKKGYPYILIHNKADKIGQIRNICWNCNNYFDIFNPENYADRKVQLEGGKMYIKCNHCGKEGNHL